MGAGRQRGWPEPPDSAVVSPARAAPPEPLGWGRTSCSLPCGLLQALAGCSPGAGGAPRAAAEPAGAEGTIAYCAPPALPGGRRAAPRHPLFARSPATPPPAGRRGSCSRQGKRGPGAATLAGATALPGSSRSPRLFFSHWELRRASIASVLGSCKVFVVWYLLFFPKRLSPGSQQRAWLDSPAERLLRCVRAGSSLSPAQPPPPGNLGLSRPPAVPP